MEVATPNFVLRYVPMFSVPPTGKRYMGVPLHPLWHKITHNYETCDNSLLLWYVNGLKAGSFKHAPRSWCTRRTRAAFQNALKERGFDRMGRRIPNTQETRQKGDLRGTVTITMNEQCMGQDFGTVQKDVSGLLDSLLYRLNNRPDEFKRLKTLEAAKKHLKRGKSRNWRSANERK
ncbi:hypothetical protein PHISP_06746 [Aspergillus sp. HF37]|nr:hypothetical protein PHISP_06746 [Aspergillus sp. HF37]